MQGNGMEQHGISGQNAGHGNATRTPPPEITLESRVCCMYAITNEWLRTF